jgi:hypothetical protein
LARSVDARNPGTKIVLFDDKWRSDLAASSDPGEPAIYGLFHESYFPEELNADWGPEEVIGPPEKNGTRK